MGRPHRDVLAPTSRSCTGGSHVRRAPLERALRLVDRDQDGLHVPAPNECTCGVRRLSGLCALPDPHESGLGRSCRASETHGGGSVTAVETRNSVQTLTRACEGRQRRLRVPDSVVGVTHTARAVVEGDSSFSSGLPGTGRPHVRSCGRDHGTFLVVASCPPSVGPTHSAAA